MCFLSHPENLWQQSHNDFWFCTLGNKGIAWIYAFITESLTAQKHLYTKHKRQNIDSKLTNVATCKVIKKYFWMLITWFWSNPIMKQQNQEHYTNLQTDLLDSPLSTRRILTTWAMSIEQYLNWQFRCIDNPDQVFADGSVPTSTQTRSGGAEPMVTQHATCEAISWEWVVLAWGWDRLPRYIEPLTLSESLNARQVWVRNNTKLVDPWYLSKSTWVQVLGETECEYCIMRRCLSNLGSCKFILPGA